jgi:hypothetical protein
MKHCGRSMRGFREQFIECKNNGYHGVGELQKYKDHPEFLPMPFSKAAKPIAKELKKNPDAGIRFVSCLRFGGTCHSGHPQCQDLRMIKADKVSA